MREVTVWLAHSRGAGLLVVMLGIRVHGSHVVCEADPTPVDHTPQDLFQITSCIW